MPLYSVNDLSGESPEESRPANPQRLPEPDEVSTIPIPRIRARGGDRKRLLAVGAVGALLIAAPIGMIGIFRDADQPSAAPGPQAPHAPSQPGGGVMNGYSEQHAAAAMPDSAWRVTHVARSELDTVVRTRESEPAADTSAGWTDLGGSVAGDPVVLTDVHGRMAAFAVGTDGGLTYNPQVDPGAERSGEWQGLGGHDLVGTPAAAQDSLGRLFVFVRSASGTLWETHETMAGTGRWTGLRTMSTPPVADDPVVQVNARHVLKLFALGADGVVWTHSQLHPGGDGWSPARGITGSVASSPAVALDHQGRLQLFAVDPTGEILQSSELGPDANRWTHWRSWETWRSGPEVFAERPEVAMDAKGSLVVFARDTEGTVHESFQSGPGRTGWKEWQDRGGDLVDLTAVVKDFEGRLCVYGIGADGSLTRTRQSGPAAGPWHEWSTNLQGNLSTS
ncbi:hypothetical protein [Saccharopolyspora sp. CA-218241]|uniref:hypothetical protein n=1 Tax=Saccharopolyspora sp. CA-218241 TaxID=3240027 RepID=UPI003D99BA83